MICRALLALARAVAVIEARRGPFERSARKQLQTPAPAAIPACPWLLHWPLDLAVLAPPPVDQQKNKSAPCENGKSAKMRSAGMQPRPAREEAWHLPPKARKAKRGQKQKAAERRRLEAALE